MQVGPDAAPLSSEERAVLDLVITRRLGYGAIATMTRMPPEVVRGRARAALTALGGADPGDDVTALLLGVAEEEQAAVARSALAADAIARSRARATTRALRAGWEDYRPPTLPAGRPQAPSWAGWATAGALVALAVLAVLVATGTLGGGDDDARGPGAVAVEAPEPVTIPLRRLEGGARAGAATIGSTARLQPYLRLQLDRLSAPAPGRVHLLWADDGSGRGFPLPVPLQQPADGPVDRRYDLSPALAPVLAISRSLELLSVDPARLPALTAAVDGLGTGEGTPTFPRRPGTVVLRGTIPRS